MSENYFQKQRIPVTEVTENPDGTIDRDQLEKIAPAIAQGGLLIVRNGLGFPDETDRDGRRNFNQLNKGAKLHRRHTGYLNQGLRLVDGTTSLTLENPGGRFPSSTIGHFDGTDRYSQVHTTIPVNGVSPGSRLTLRRYDDRLYEPIRAVAEHYADANDQELPNRDVVIHADPDIEGGAENIHEAVSSYLGHIPAITADLRVGDTAVFPNGVVLDESTFDLTTHAFQSVDLNGEPVEATRGVAVSQLDIKW